MLVFGGVSRGWGYGGLPLLPVKDVCYQNGARTWPPKHIPRLQQQTPEACENLLNKDFKEEGSCKL